MAITITPADLRIGVRIVTHDTVVTILGGVEPYADPFGQHLLKRWARREDIGKEGWFPYGPLAVFVLCPDVCPTCGAHLDRQGYPFAHQHYDTGAECAFTWEPLS